MFILEYKNGKDMKIIEENVIFVRPENEETSFLQIQDFQANPTVQVDINNRRVGINTNAPICTFEVQNPEDYLCVRLESKSGKHCYINFRDEGGQGSNTYFGVENSVGGGINQGTSPHACVLTVHPDNRPFELCTGNAVQIRVASDGGVYMFNLKSGTSQQDAGASSSELWFDSSSQSVKMGI